MLNRPPTGARGRRSVLVSLSGSSREALRTNLWSVPTLMVLLSVGLFAFTYQLDVRADTENLPIPAWVTSGGPDVARQVLIAIAAAAITVGSPTRRIS